MTRMATLSRNNQQKDAYSVRIYYVLCKVAEP
jgi:hypothetical protein